MRFNDTLITLLKQSLEQNIVPALMGEPGIGKSSAVSDLAYALNTKAFVLPCNTLADKSDLTGARLVPTDTGGYMQVFYPHHSIQEAVDYALANPRETPILLLDEINRTSSDVTSGALTLTTMRKIGHVELPSNLRIVVAGNTKGNVVALDEASLSRFAIFNVEPDADTLVQILGDSLNQWVKQVLVDHPELVFEKSRPTAIVADGDDDDKTATIADLFDGGDEMTQLTTPRTIDNLSRWLNAAALDELGHYLATPGNGAADTLLDEIVQAMVGNTQFASEVVAQIASALSSGSARTDQNRVNVPRPSCYDDLKAAGTVTELESLLAGLTDNERAGSMVFAISERADNARLVALLAGSVTSTFSSEHTQTLIQLVARNQYDRGNLEALTSSGTPLADSMGAVLSAFI